LVAHCSLHFRKLLDSTGHFQAEVERRKKENDMRESLSATP